jgi:glycosyltransferase involved in cell wall biosynthesis
VLGPSSDQLLAPVGDAAALAQMILNLAEDRFLCSAVGAENKRIVAEKYDAQRMCEETVALFVEQGLSTDHTESV